MTWYAWYDPAQPAPQAVDGWYDTDYKNYTLPTTGALLELTEGQWAQRLATPYVNKDALIAEAPPTAVQLLAAARASQIAALNAACVFAMQQPVSYTSEGGITTIWQADPQSIASLSAMLLAFQLTRMVPESFYWVAADNTQVPFSYSDMQALMQVIGEQRLVAFQHLQTRKTGVKAAATVMAVQAIVWA